MNRRKAQELGYRMLRPANLDILFEYWEMHGLGWKAWEKQMPRIIHLKEQSSRRVDHEDAKALRHLLRTRIKK